MFQLIDSDPQTQQRQAHFQPKHHISCSSAVHAVSLLARSKSSSLPRSERKSRSLLLRSRAMSMMPIVYSHLRAILSIQLLRCLKSVLVSCFSLQERLGLQRVFCTPVGLSISMLARTKSSQTTRFVSYLGERSGPFTSRNYFKCFSWGFASRFRILDAITI